MRLLIFISFFLLFKSNSALNSQELCTKSNSKIKCLGVYGFECDFHICTLNKDKCVDFKALEFSTRVSRYSRDKKTEQIKYAQFKKQVKQCPTVKREWNSKDVCVNGMKCPSFKFDVMIRNMALEFVECPCPQKHPFRCSKDFCAVDKSLCEQLKIKAKKNYKILRDFTTCMIRKN